MIVHFDRVQTHTCAHTISLIYIIYIIYIDIRIPDIRSYNNMDTRIDTGPRPLKRMPVLFERKTDGGPFLNS